ncbi:DUF3379 family protein [Vibrio ulleungensis]|uniref:DUF3379 domain-containing protein n=1 Tax=Vibrio ulleungensis TaxID=2807619 RepID=A0ABS2HFC6_9VIBR|nr:DUF3379 family protein [Vibrio ulleungensis]MBM7036275.1 DUF3379 domain-containing protein [Vibrio ulleungensis]
MDELEFRRRVISDPKNRDAEVAEHVSDNPSQAKFIDEMLSLDARIEQAMRVDVPEDLADKILFQNSNNVVTPSFGKRALSIAASVAFAVGLAAGQLNWGALIAQPAYASLSQTAMEHVHAERPFTNALDEQAEMPQLNMKLQPFEFKFTEDFPYHVYYLNHCGFGESTAMHVEFAGEKGRVTLFITKISADSASQFSDETFAGELAPMGDATLIVVGEQDENLNAIVERLVSIIEPTS